MTQNWIVILFVRVFVVSLLFQISCASKQQTTPIIAYFIIIIQSSQKTMTQNNINKSTLNSKAIAKKFTAGLSIVPVAIIFRSFLAPLVLPPSIMTQHISKINFQSIKGQVIYSFLFPLKDLYYQWLFSEKKASTMEFLETNEKTWKLGNYYAGALAGSTIWAIHAPGYYLHYKNFNLYNPKTLLFSQFLQITILRSAYLGVYSSVKDYTIQKYHNWNIYYSILASTIASLAMKILDIPFRNYRTKNYLYTGYLGERIPFYDMIVKFFSLFRMPKPLQHSELIMSRVTLLQNIACLVSYEYFKEKIQQQNRAWSF